MNAPSRIARFLLWSAGGLLAVVVVAIVGLTIYAYRPYLDVTEVRASARPTTVRITSAVGCEDAYYVAADGRRYRPVVPANGKGLEEDIGLFISGNSYLLTGYPYKLLLRNIFTGTVAEERSERFDVVEWSIVIPYTTLGENGEEIESRKPLGWRADDAVPQFAANADRPRDSGC